MALNLSNEATFCSSVGRAVKVGKIRDDGVAEAKEPDVIDLTKEDEDNAPPEAEAKPFDFLPKRRCWGCCPGCLPECAPGACPHFQPNQEAHYEGCLAE